MPEPELIGADGGNGRLRRTLRAASNRTGTDRAVVFGVLWRFWQLAAGPLTLLLIARFVSPEKQGYYYTFGSIIALQSFWSSASTS